jgi:hypothetical protein
VAEYLTNEPGCDCRILSLCELRGLPSPVADFQESNVVLIKLLDHQLRSSPAVGNQRAFMRTGWVRHPLRWSSWHLSLGRLLKRQWRKRPCVVVLPNDSAFPYNYIAHALKEMSIPFLLVQEGIRFPLPSERENTAYGLGGAAAIAAWGESSAEHFRRIGVPAYTIHVTGNPRFDHVLSTDFESAAAKLRSDWQLGHKNLLFFSNPIDDQGFCTTEEKLALIRQFLQALTPVFDDPEIQLVIKLHARESAVDIVPFLDGHYGTSRIKVIESAPLYPLLAAARAAIILASTVGLEALLFDLPLGVLEIPGYGFAHDYVSMGAAVGLLLNHNLPAQVMTLMSDTRLARDKVKGYVSNNLLVDNRSAERVARLILQTASTKVQI